MSIIINICIHKLLFSCNTEQKAVYIFIYILLNAQVLVRIYDFISII